MTQKLRSGAKSVEHLLDKCQERMTSIVEKECTSSVEQGKVLNGNFWAKMYLRFILSNEDVVRKMIGTMCELDPSWLLSWVCERREIRFISYYFAILEEDRSGVLKRV